MSNFWEAHVIKKKGIDIIQINMGNMCNLACKHCHIEALPKGNKKMNREKQPKKLQTSFKGWILIRLN